MNFHWYKTIAIIAFSLCLTANGYGTFAEQACFEMPCENCGKFIFEAEFLILRPYEKESDHCAFNQMTNSVDIDGNILTTLENKNHNNFKWQPGFRIGAGYAIGNCNWKYGISWMHFNSKFHTRHENTRRWNLDFDTLNAVAAYTFCGSDCFSITSFGGIRGAKIDQHIHLTTVFINPIQNRDEQKFWGVGPVIGLETNCKIACDLSLYAYIDVSWLYGKYDIKLNDRSSFNDGSTSIQERKHFFTNQLVSDAGLGVQWTKEICKYKIFLRLGLEHHHYFDYNYLENSDLSLSGGNISAGFEF